MALHSSHLVIEKQIVNTDMKEISHLLQIQSGKNTNKYLFVFFNLISTWYTFFVYTSIHVGYQNISIKYTQKHILHTYKNIYSILMQ